MLVIMLGRAARDAERLGMQRAGLHRLPRLPVPHGEEARYDYIVLYCIIPNDNILIVHYII